VPIQIRKGGRRARDRETAADELSATSKRAARHRNVKGQIAGIAAIGDVALHRGEIKVRSSMQITTSGGKLVPEPAASFDGRAAS